MSLLKSLERSLRRRFLAATDRPFTGDFVTTPRDAFHLGDAPRILLLRQDRIGDVLVSVPVIRALRQRYPHALIHMLFSAANYGVRHAVAPYVDHAWRYDKTPASAVRLVGAVRAAAARANVRTHMVASSTVRKHFIDSGGLKSKEAKRAVIERCRLLGWAVEDDNAADATACWSYGISLVAPKWSPRSTPLFSGARA